MNHTLLTLPQALLSSWDTTWSHDLAIAEGAHWAIVGLPVQAQSALLRFCKNALGDCAEISLERQAELVDAERQRARIGMADQFTTGSTVQDLLLEAGQHNAAHCEALAAQLALEPLLQRPFEALSTGETRRLLTAMALAGKPRQLLTDNLLDGLDPGSVASVVSAIDRYTAAHDCTSIQLYRQASTLPDCTEQLWQWSGRWQHQVIAPGESATQYLRPPPRARRFALPTIPEQHPFHRLPALEPGQPLVEMRNVSVQYVDQPDPILNALDWRVQAGEHWAIRGPNGSGKTTLLRLVTGDHPQCYRNDITVFGMRRGSGESIWEVKQRIGAMNAEIFWQHQRGGGGTALSVIINGLYDSVGVHGADDVADRDCAMGWLQLLDMPDCANRRFIELSLPEQRLVLIARAMIKQPALLILDEPCSGLDAEGVARVGAIVEALMASGRTTVLFVSHGHELAEQFEHTLFLD